jgi:hypothetical protein
MKYVSAEWVHDEVLDTYTIKATGDDGVTYWLGSIDSDVPPWPEFLAEGGTVTGSGPPEEPPA